MTHDDRPDGFPVRSARILLVEDSPDQAYLLSALVEKMGPYQVTVAQDGVRALELVEQDLFDLVVTDLNVPGMDGFDLTTRIKARSPGLPIVAVTGHTTPAHLEGAVRAGADTVISKPVQPSELKGVLQELLGRRVPAAYGPRRVVAIAVEPWDLVLGCGGSLLAHRGGGHSLALAVVAGDAGPLTEALGAEVLDTREGIEPALAASLAEEPAPVLAYVPSPCDGDERQRRLWNGARDALAPVPDVLGYATTTSTLEFRPDIYRDVMTWMEAKLALLEALDGTSRPPAEFVRAHALYWGRLARFRAVEPFEKLGDSSLSPDSVNR